MTATMPRPGSIVTTRTSPPPRTVPTDTGTWFVTGFTDRGPANKAVLVQSLTEFISIFGTRQTYSVLYDALESYFREGGAKAYIGRVVGPASTIATVNLLDAGAAISLVAKAKGPGTYGNSRRVTVQSPGNGGTASSFSILVTDSVDTTISEQSPDFLTQASAIAWSQQSSNIDLTLGASALNPVAVSNAALTTGTDDRLNATDATWRNALALFNRDLGPGQVSQVGRTTTTAHGDTLTHANLNNRFAILDAPDTPTVATLKTTATTVRTTAPQSGYAKNGMLFAPWVVIPGIVPGTTRIAPPSAFVAARISAKDSSGSTPNAPAAGNDGVLRTAIGLSQPAYDAGTGVDVTRDDMYTAGVNLIVSRYGAYEVFGWRTLVDPNGADQDWLNAGNSRLAMYIVAQGLKIAENYILDEIDGRGRTFKAFEGDIRGVMGDLYSRGSLYDGGSGKPEDAYSVDTGPQINTPATVANRELHAAVAARMTQDAELVVIEIAKVPVTQSL